MDIIGIQKLLVGAKINWIKRTCDLIMFDFIKMNNSVALHSECFVRISQKDTTLLSSNDIYVCGRNTKKRKYRWDKPGASLFDESLIDCKELVYDKEIVDVLIENAGLKIVLNDDILIEIIPNSVQDVEHYRIFTKDEVICTV